MGIDPSLASTGYAFLKYHNNQFTALNFGEIKTSAQNKLSERLVLIHHTISALMKTYSPTEVAIEEVFYAANPKVALTMGHARGAVLVAAALGGLIIAEYSPREIKMAVTGYGNASKEQVRRMVLTQLTLNSTAIGYDVADAFAAAICHCHRSKSQFGVMGRNS